MQNNKKNIFVGLAIITLFALFIVPIFTVQAEEGSKILENLNSSAQDSYNTTTPPGETTIAETIGGITKIVLGFLGLIFIILIIYSGFQWMTAGGNEQTITDARQRIINATIGLIIILASYVIVNVIMLNISSVTNLQ